MEGNGTITLEPRQAVRTMLLADLVGELVTDAEAAAAARASGRARGPVTGLPALDEALGGYLAPGVHVLQAAPGAGKTAFSLQVAANCGAPALFVTAEMPRLELFRRIIARTTRTYLGRLKTGELSPEAVRDLALRAIQACPMVAIMIDWEDGHRGEGPGQVTRTCGEWIERFGRGFLCSPAPPQEARPHPGARERGA